jgi:Tol biopolymer transport system component
MAVTSEPVSMVEGVMMAGGITGAANYGFTSGGGLVYVAETGTGANRLLVWVDRESNVEPLSFPPRGYNRTRISPEEDRIAVEITEGEGTDIWILDIETSTSQRLTFEGTNVHLVWSPDGEWVYFDSNRGGDRDIWRKRTDLSADAEPVYEAERAQAPYSISADGTKLLFSDQGAGDWDVQMLPLDGDPEPTMLEGTDADTLYPWISPDGRLVAFQSDETGRAQIHVREIETGSRWTISTGGGRYPVWSRDGTEIFYRSGPGQRSVVEVTREPELSFSAPRQLFEVSGFLIYNDVTADGQRFLGRLLVESLETEGEPATPRINVILNWFEELKQRVPTGGSQ